MAKAIPKKGSRGRIGSRKSTRKIPKGVIHIQASFNNTIVTVTDVRGRVVSWSSAGTCGFRGTRRGTPFAAQTAAANAIRAVPMNIFWQAPQYIFQGAAEVFFIIGQLEFFYDQSPDAMRSLCSALSLLTTALGNYLSSFILSMVAYFTARGGKPGWIPDNLNEGHLDYFFWLLAGLSFLNMLVYIICAKVYKSKAAS